MNSEITVDKKIRELKEGASLKNKFYLFDNKYGMLKKIALSKMEACDLSTYKDLISNTECEVISCSCLVKNGKVVAIYDANVYHLTMNSDFTLNIEDSQISNASKKYVKLLVEKEFADSDYAYILTNLASKLGLVREIKMDNIQSLIPSCSVEYEKLTVTQHKLNKESSDDKERQYYQSDLEMYNREVALGLKVDKAVHSQLKDTCAKM